ncbi:Crp/Fnr family transcriptional regulator [Frigidibacter sp. SD6-1]|uniref:Crp/Fnr family transcriptional regulator n=1 Tax=Frigidibacter sp. SD6-1 TaxID=3032581 RepID=UPI0024DF5CDB|nr:Crp/Fnr family transcriptional regulator [Frigidibacter sp. SD6-1]
MRSRTPYSAKEIILSHLRAVALLAPLRPDYLERLAERALVVRYRRGQVIHTEGEPVRGLSIVLAGTIDAVLSEADGRQAFLASHGPGSVIGLSDLADGRGGSATLLAVGDCQAIRLSERDSRALLMLDVMQAAIAREARAELAVLRENFRRLSLYSLEKRLASYLRDRAETSDGAEAPIPLKDSQPRIATLVHASRTRVNITLQKWASEGEITLERGRVTVTRSDAFWRRYDLAGTNE